MTCKVSGLVNPKCPYHGLQPLCSMWPLWNSSQPFSSFYPFVVFLVENTMVLLSDVRWLFCGLEKSMWHFVKELKEEGKGKKSLFWRLIWGQVRGEGHPHWRAMTACSCLGNTASLKDALKGMSGQRCSGIWLFEAFPCIWYPKSSLQPGCGWPGWNAAVQ